MSRILVTGASGFVGRQLCRILLERGETVLAGARSSSTTPVAGAQPLITGDLSESQNLTSRLVGVDVVVHLAARAHVLQDTVADPLVAFRRANLDATRQLARQAAAAEVKRLVFLSSIKVNGERTEGTPFREVDPAAPEDAYGQSKREAELALEALASDTGMEITVLRPPLVYGPGVKANFLRLLRLVDRGIPLPLAGIRNQRSLVSIWNLCDLIATCTSHPEAAGELFLVSDQKDLSTPGLIRALAEALGRRAHLIPFPAAVLRGAGRLLGQAGAIERLVGSLQLDSGKATRLLGWRPPLTVEEGLKRTASWYLDRKEGEDRST